jgi:hypothetical protein
MGPKILGKFLVYIHIIWATPLLVKPFVDHHGFLAQLAWERTPLDGRSAHRLLLHPGLAAQSSASAVSPGTQGIPHNWQSLRYPECLHLQALPRDESRDRYVRFLVLTTTASRTLTRHRTQIPISFICKSLVSISSCATAKALHMTFLTSGRLSIRTGNVTSSL